MTTSSTRNASGKSKNKNRILSRFMMTSALVAVGTFGFIPFADAADIELPVFGSLAGGNAIVTTNPALDKMNIDQVTDRVIINWNTFNIGADATVRFYQPNSGSLAVNKVTDSVTFTRIDGKLKANGKVVILDPNGIIFGDGSVTDVGAIVASTGNVDNTAVMAGGLMQLTNFGTGKIVNKGKINAADSGLVAFVGSTVKNSGVIRAKLGRVSLAAGNETATVDLYGDGLVELSYTNKNEDLLSENTGKIKAVGGTIQMTAAQAKDTVDSVVNMKGIAKANSAIVTNGKIILSAGKKVKVGSGAKVKGNTTITSKTVDLDSTIDGTVTGSATKVNILSDSAKIAQGLNVVDANGTVNVAAGTYNEHLVIDKSGITLRGANAGIAGSGIRGAETIINPNSPGVTIVADNVTVNGLLFAGATGLDGYGIFVDNADNATLKNNVIDNVSQYGVYLLNSLGSVVNNNAINNTGNHGIYALNSANTSISRNRVGTLGGNNNIKGDNILVDRSNGTSISENILTESASTALDIGSGIHVKSSDNVSIANNTIYGNEWDGIKITRGTNVSVSGNNINDVTRTAIYAEDTKDLSVLLNTINNAKLWGIQAIRINGANISDNLISNTVRDGINIGNSNSGLKTVSNNTINNTGLNGIHVFASNGTIIDGNKVGLLGGVDNIKTNGIFVTNSSDVSVLENDISNAKQNGISLLNLGGLVEANLNTISNSGANGIYVSNYNGSSLIISLKTLEESSPSILSGLYINNNIISNSGSNGIYVDGASGYVEIKSNDITDSGNNGIYVVNYSPSYFDYPVFARVSEEDTVVPERMDGLYINLNEISNSGSVMETEYSRNYSNGNGIEVVNASGYVEIADNDIYNSGMNGIYVHGYNDSYYPSKSYYGGNNLELLITGNFVTDSGSNGVYLSGLNGDLTVSNNEIYNSDYNGVLVDNVNQNYGDMYYLNKVSILEESEEPEIYPIYPVYPNNQLIISGNDIDNSGYDGVSINQTGGYVSVDNNTITDSGENGIYVYNSSLYYDVIDGGDEMMTSRFMDYPYGYNNPIELHIVDNTVENVGFVPSQDGESDVAEEAPNGFAAINLDISGDGYAEISGNTLGNNFEYGLYARSGEIDLTGATNTIQNTAIGMGFYPAPKGAPDEDSEGYFDFLASQLKLTNDTIGTTAFVDQSEFFVDLGYGAFFAPGTPTILNGNDATYTLGGATIAPSVYGGVTQAEYDVLEARFNHFVDFQNRGLFFFNILPDLLTFDQEDVFRTFNFPTEFGQGGSLIVTGLPRIAGVAAPVAGGFNPNAIEPAAGDDGTTGGDAAAAGIEPAAGGATNSACWADATQALGQGTPVSFNFGGGSSALLQDAANCGSGTNDQNL